MTFGTSYTHNLQQALGTIQRFAEQEPENSSTVVTADLDIIKRWGLFRKIFFRCFMDRYLHQLNPHRSQTQFRDFLRKVLLSTDYSLNSPLHKTCEKACLVFNRLIVRTNNELHPSKRVTPSTDLLVSLEVEQRISSTKPPESTPEKVGKPISQDSWRACDALSEDEGSSSDEDEAFQGYPKIATPISEVPEQGEEQSLRGVQKSESQPKALTSGSLSQTAEDLTTPHLPLVTIMVSSPQEAQGGLLSLPKVSSKEEGLSSVPAAGNFPQISETTDEKSLAPSQVAPQKPALPQPEAEERTAHLRRRRSAAPAPSSHPMKLRERKEPQGKHQQ